MPVHTNVELETLEIPEELQKYFEAQKRCEKDRLTFQVTLKQAANQESGEDLPVVPFDNIEDAMAFMQSQYKAMPGNGGNNAGETFQWASASVLWFTNFFALLTA